MECNIIHGDCKQFLKDYQSKKFDLTFLDPPFNQGKAYDSHNDNMPEHEYWEWMKEVCKLIYNQTSDGGAIYFMQREKNAQFVLEALKLSGWVFQNLIIWKKKSSAIPSNLRFGKHYQIIAFATKGNKPRVFNRLRIDPILLVTEKYKRPTGMYLTDIWDDIRELTSGYFAGDEPLKSDDNKRLHNQQSPIHLLTRIILSSSKPGDLIFDPFAGTGTTLVVASQLKRMSIGVEIDSKNIFYIKNRLLQKRSSDNILKYRNNYIFTKNLNNIWPLQENNKDSGQYEMQYENIL
jgi:DNA modification methylase